MKTRKPLPTVEYLKECFEYREDGSLVWKHRPLNHFKSNAVGLAFNTTWAGKVAGSKSTKNNKERGSGYWTVIIMGKTYLIHRLIYKIFYNKEPFIIDHINNDHQDNRIENLQTSDRRENKMKSPIVKNNSGYRGVFSRKDRNSYEVRVTLPGWIGRKDIHVGYYKNKDEAAQAYNIALTMIYEELMIETYKNITDFPVEQVNLDKSFFKNWEGVSSLV